MSGQVHKEELCNECGCSCDGCGYTFTCIKLAGCPQCGCGTTEGSEQFVQDPHPNEGYRSGGL